MSDVIREITAILGARMASSLDDAIRKALAAHLGTNAFTPEELKDRLERVSLTSWRSESPETYCCDGRPLLRVWPVELVPDDSRPMVMTAKQQIQYLIDVGPD